MLKNKVASFNQSGISAVNGKIREQLAVQQMIISSFIVEFISLKKIREPPFTTP